MKENVAIIFDGLYGGGAERIAGLLSIYLSERFNVFLFLERTDKFVYDYKGTIVDCGKSGTEFMEYNVMLAKKKYNIQYSISFMEFFNYINIKTKQQDVVIISERCNLTHVVPHSYYDELMVKRLYQCADHIVAISEGVKLDLINEYGIASDKITTIYNFIDKNAIIEKAKLNEIRFEKTAKKLIVSIGRLEEQKNHKRLLYQFKHIYDTDKDVQLAIIGNGQLYDDLIELINQLGLDCAVNIIPYSSNPFSILKQADIFVLTSKYEGLGNVLLEAMCLGIPIISVDCPSGPAELLSDHYSNGKDIVKTWEKCERGILVTPAQSEDDLTSAYLSEAINYLFTDEKYRLEIIRNQKRYINLYSTDTILAAWIEVLNKANNSCEKRWDFEPKLNVIYGAGEYCRRLIKEMRENNREIYAILVSDLKNNPLSIDGIPVCKIEQFMGIRNKINIILGVYDFKIIEQMCRNLLDNGFMYVERPMLLPDKRER